MLSSAQLRVVLVSLNRRRYYSLALDYVKLFALRDQSLSASVRIFTLQERVGRNLWTLLRILTHRPKIVGFSCNIWNIRQTMTLAGWLKRVRPEIRIVFGGQEVTHSCEDVLAKCPAADVVVDGEGEETFRQLLRAWLENQWTRLEAIPGISFRREGKTVANPPAPMIEGLDNIPSPYLEGALAPPRKSPLGLMLESSRGCPFHCSFCFEGSRFPKVRTFSLDRMEKEVAWAMARGIRSFHILDPVLGNGDPRRLKAIHDIMEKHMAPRAPYSCSVEVQAELLTAETVPLLRHFTVFDIGLQTITPEALRHIRRGFHRQRFLAGVEQLKKLHRRTNIYLLLGLPGENFFSFLRSVQFCLGLNVTQLFINHLCVLNGTGLRKSAADLKLRHQEDPPYYTQSAYSFSESELLLAKAFSESIMREHSMVIPYRPESLELL